MDTRVPPQYDTHLNEGSTTDIDHIESSESAMDVNHNADWVGREEINRVLGGVDPSSNLKAARKDHQPGTSEWFLNRTSARRHVTRFSGLMGIVSAY